LTPPIERSGAFLFAERQDAGERADKLDRQRSVFLRDQVDLLDQRPQRLGRITYRIFRTFAERGGSFQDS